MSTASQTRNFLFLTLPIFLVVQGVSDGRIMLRLVPFGVFDDTISGPLFGIPPGVAGLRRQVNVLSFFEN